MRFVEAGIYHAGKSLTYGGMGMVVGLAGASVRVAGYQQVLSVAVGTVMLVAVLLPRRFTEKMFFNHTGGGRYALWSRWFSRFLGHPSLWSLAGLGMLTGFLPCGLVYVALGGAMVSSGALEGFFYMFVFGLGTTPMLAAIFLMRQSIPAALRLRLLRLVPVGLAMVSVLLILRGLSLGIPYVSPDSSPAAAGDACCH
jgi:hypothetical protein